jgi:hypothetical protein
MARHHSSTAHRCFVGMIVIPLALLLALAGAARADEVQKVGTTSMQMLKVATSTRAIGLGETYTSVADDIQSVFWNPAGLIHINGTSVYFAQINMPADVQFNSAAVARNYGRYGVLGVHLLALTTGDMPVRTVSRPEGTGENFTAYDIVGGVSYAQLLTDRVIFGTNLRLALSGIDDAKYTGILADFGTLYETALRTLKIGFAVQNFGPDIKYSGTYLDWLDKGRRARLEPQTKEYSGAPPPTIYRIGLSANLFTMTGLVRPYNWDGLMAVEMSHPNDNRERINLGLEMVYMDILVLRGGYKVRYKNYLGYDEERWTTGFGLIIPVTGAVRMKFDYAFMDFGRIFEATDRFAWQPHRLSVAVNF